MSELCRKPNNKYILWYIKSRLKEHTKQTMLLMKFVNTGKKWIQIWNILSWFLQKLVVFLLNLISRDRIKFLFFFELCTLRGPTLQILGIRLQKSFFQKLNGKSFFRADFGESGEFNFGYITRKKWKIFIRLLMGGKVPEML